MPKRGFLFDITDEMENSGVIHQRLVAKLEHRLGRNIICYVANVMAPAASILDVDSEVIESLLRSVDLDRRERKITLLLESPGGSPYAAEKIVRVLRAYSSDDAFEVIVPNQAMSAATLVCLGSRKVLMGKTSKLGPIDPQMIYTHKGQQAMRPAKAFSDAFIDAVRNAQQAIANEAPPDPFYRLLDNMDYSWVIECIRARKASKTIAEDLLSTGMLAGDNNQENIDKAVSELLEAGEAVHHARPIYWKRAREDIGLTVELLDMQSKDWCDIWELYVRMQRHANSKGLAKYFCVRSGGIDFRLRRGPR